MAEIKASDVAKLRQATGAGMMDCKQALTESNGDFEAAIDFLRKKGQKVASKRADRDATEGCVIAKIADDKKNGVIVTLNCETDFVAINADFVKLTESFAQIALQNKPANLEALLALKTAAGITIAEEVMNQNGVIGEKIALSFYGCIDAAFVCSYIHPGNKLGALVGFNKDIDPLVGKNIAMQIAASKPVALDKDQVPQELINKEIEIGKELAINEGKPAEMAEKIAMGRLNKYFQESTLLNQEYIMDTKKSVRQYLQEVQKDLTVVDFKLQNLG